MCCSGELKDRYSGSSSSTSSDNYYGVMSDGYYKADAVQIQICDMIVLYYHHYHRSITVCIHAPIMSILNPTTVLLLLLLLLW